MLNSKVLFHSKMCRVFYKNEMKASYFCLCALVTVRKRMAKVVLIRLEWIYFTYHATTGLGLKSLKAKQRTEKFNFEETSSMRVLIYMVDRLHCCTSGKLTIEGCRR